jgi:hypothetical protein
MTAQVKHAYKGTDGKKLPSVTTIIGRVKDSGGLLYWANKMGLEGKTLDQARHVETTPGTITHEWVEANIRGEDYTPQGDADSIAKAKSAFSAFEKWRDSSHIEFKHTEVPLASAKHKFGGTLDAIGVSNGQLCLYDWKAANSVYADYLYQLAAYGILWEENYPNHPITGGYYLCRFSKEGGDFSTHYFPSLDEEKETFLLIRKLYDRFKITEKRVR